MNNKEILNSYIIGFVLSIILTFAAYFAVVNHLMNGFGLIVFILVLAVAQLVVQLFFFLHMGKESNPRWNLFMFLGTVGMVILVVVASLWIMYHLNYNMTPQLMEKSIMMEEGIGK